MTARERREFRSFCEQATGSQLLNIIAKERKAARDGKSQYRWECYQIAITVGRERDLTSEV